MINITDWVLNAYLECFLLLFLMKLNFFKGGKVVVKITFTSVNMVGVISHGQFHILVYFLI